MATKLDGESLTAGPAPRLASLEAADGYRMAVRVWSATHPRARVVLLHGIVSHGGWYLGTGRYLAARGCEVHLIDRRGSGLNSVARGDVRDHGDWLSDVEHYLEKLPREVPLCLAGISWGGKLAAAVAAHRCELVDGWAMVCPGLYARQQAGLVRRAALRVLHGLGLGGMSVPIPLGDPALFTDCPTAQQYLRTDPFTLRRITVRFAIEDLLLNRLARDTERAHDRPALLMLAGRDRIVDNRRTRLFFEALPGNRKTLIEYADAAHTLEFDEGRTLYWRDLGRWIEGLSGGAGRQT